MKVSPWLLICGVPPADWSYQIQPGRQVIGRTSSCEICIRHRTVSRRHAEITYDEGVFRIVDLGSSNGTHVNGTRIDYAEFQVGDGIEIGKVTLEVVESLFAEQLIGDDDGTDRPVVTAPDSFDTAYSLLSPMDQKVIKLLLQGLTERDVADQLEMSRHTIHWRVQKRIYRLLGIHSRSELFALFMKPKRAVQ